MKHVLCAAILAAALSSAAQAQTAMGANAGMMTMNGMAQQMNTGIPGSPVVSSSWQKAGGQVSFQSSTLGNPANVLTNTVQGSGSMKLDARGYSIGSATGASGIQGGFAANNITNPATFGSFPGLGQ